MAKFLHLTEMPGLHLPWLDVALPEPDEEIDFLALNLSQNMTLTEFTGANASDDAPMTTAGVKSSARKSEALDSGLPFSMDMDSTDGRSRVSF